MSGNTALLWRYYRLDDAFGIVGGITAGCVYVYMFGNNINTANTIQRIRAVIITACEWAVIPLWWAMSRTRGTGTVVRSVTLPVGMSKRLDALGISPSMVFQNAVAALLKDKEQLTEDPQTLLKKWAEAKEVVGMLNSRLEELKEENRVLKTFTRRAQ